MSSSAFSLARKWGGLFCAAALTIAVFDTARAAAPANDNFVNRSVLSGTPAIGTGDNTSATRESFERDLTGEATLWWSWTAPADGVVTVNIQGTAVNGGRFAVFNGAQIDQLTLIGYGDDDDNVIFPTVAGAVYQISAGSLPYNTGRGTVVLDVKLGPKTITSPTVIGTPANGNDNFAARTTLTGTAVSGIGYSDDSTDESFEPTLCGTRTLWWTWTSPADGTLTINAAGSSLSDPRVAVFNGSEIDQLTTVDYVDNYGNIIIPTVAGAVYQISVGDVPYSTDTGNIVLNIKLGPKTIASPTVVQPPADANDNFANRVTLTGALVSGIGHPIDATRESNEPTISVNSTLWWTWTPPFSGIVTVDTTGTNFSNRFVVYTGSTLATLKTLTGYNGTVTQPASEYFDVEAGTTYQISVGAQNTTGSTSVLNISLVPHPSFFSGEAALNGGFYYLQFPNGNLFGYYSYANYPYLYHDDMGFLYFIDAQDGNGGAYLYDFASRDFFYTSPTFGFPYLYDFGLRTVLYYFPDSNNPGHYSSSPRYFFNYATGKIITK